MPEPKDSGIVLRGNLVEQYNHSREIENVTYLNDVVAPLAEKYGGFGIVLSGESPLNMEPSYALDLSPFSKEPKYGPVTSGGITSTIATAWDTGVDINKLAEASPADKWKFYLSLNLSTPEQMQHAQGVFGKLLALCREGNISLLTKSLDHNYDSCNLYTWSPVKMADILKTLYPQYPDIWLPVYHFFQAPISSIDPMHIGYVQEPSGGHKGTSHSGRMAILGDALDSQGNALVTSEGFEEACSRAGVMSSAPWKITA